MEKLTQEYFNEQSKVKYEDLIGKSMKVVHTGSKTYHDGNKFHSIIKSSYISYIFDIKSYVTDPETHIDSLAGKGVRIDFWSEKMELDAFDMWAIDDIGLNFKYDGKLEKDECYLIDKEEGLAEIDYYYKQGLLKGILDK